jgi:cytochrome c biogenesis protein CcmG/thiol:disulfide interchange protein DsbE
MKPFKLNQISPFIILFGLLCMLCNQLYSANKIQTNPEIIREPLPAFSLPYLNNPEQTLTQKDLKGKVSLLNIWASWCYACKMEHETLMDISKTYGIPIYGILYKDDASDALKYLTRHGNPYTAIGNDESGEAGDNFGIYGTPETYVVSANGDIIYRQEGAMSERTWKTIIYPIVQQYLEKKKAT